jgi:hypothetical protein
MVGKAREDPEVPDMIHNRSRLRKGNGICADLEVGYLKVRYLVPSKLGG